MDADGRRHSVPSFLILILFRMILTEMTKIAVISDPLIRALQLIKPFYVSPTFKDFVKGFQKMNWAILHLPRGKPINWLRRIFPRSRRTKQKQKKNKTAHQMIEINVILNQSNFSPPKVLQKSYSGRIVAGGRLA